MLTLQVLYVTMPVCLQQPHYTEATEVINNAPRKSSRSFFREVMWTPISLFFWCNLFRHYDIINVVIKDYSMDMQ